VEETDLLTVFDDFDSFNISEIDSFSFGSVSTLGTWRDSFSFFSSCAGGLWVEKDSLVDGDFVSSLFKEEELSSFCLFFNRFLASTFSRASFLAFSRAKALAFALASSEDEISLTPSSEVSLLLPSCFAYGR
jgi:hypothetical protein